MAVRITAYLDGATVGCGYKFIVTKDPCSWRAYQTNRGLKRFLTLFGLSIDPAQTELHDYRDIGRGRCITMVCKDKIVNDDFGGFFRIEDVPKEAKEYFDIVNGNYVRCYILDEGHTVTTYKPNPNSVYYQPLDYWYHKKLYG